MSLSPVMSGDLFDPKKKLIVREGQSKNIATEVNDTIVNVSRISSVAVSSINYLVKLSTNQSILKAAKYLPFLAIGLVAAGSINFCRAMVEFSHAVVQKITRR